MASNFVPSYQQTQQMQNLTGFYRNPDSDIIRKDREPVDRFLISLDANRKKFDKDFSVADENLIIEMAKKMSFPQYKNPTAFLMGYRVLKPSSKFEIDEKEWINMLDYMQKSQEEEQMEKELQIKKGYKKDKKDDKKSDISMFENDLLRYTRLIYNLRMK